ncbi:YkvA family protein [Phormidesmis sp. 146-33]
MPSLKQFAKSLKREIHVVYLASKDPRVPWYAKLLAVLIRAYAVSPIDLIPDFIPILGQLDDLIIVPLGIWLVLKMIPPAVLSDCRSQVASDSSDHPGQNWIVAGAIVTIWFLIGVLMVYLIGLYLNK